MADISNFDGLKEWTCLIGDVAFMVPPTSIRCITQTTTERIPLVRAKGTIAKGGEHSDRLIEIHLFFNEEEGINGVSWTTDLPTAKSTQVENPEDAKITYYMNGLRALVSEFRLVPYVPIDNKYINLMLSMTRHIPQAHQSIMEGRWDRKSFTGIQLLNKTVGIIGVGRVGSNVAKRLQAFNMKTIGYDPYITLERGKQLGVELVDLDTLLKESDYITLHTPLTDETRGMIGEKELAKMKDGVRLVNASRGAVVDIKALADALKSGKVAGAGIDVWPNEPLKPEENPFLGMTNVALTPHLGASTKEAQAGVATDVAVGVAQALHGEPVATAVNASPITKATLHVIQPYFNLCERMGNIAIDLAGGRISTVNIEYTGELTDTETAPLTTAVLKGLLSPVLQQTVNFVNARGIAEERHIDVREVKAKKGHYYTNTISLTIDTDKGTHRITGSLFDRKDAKIVSLDHFRVDFEPKGCIIIAPHEDKPGMIGQVASVLGSAGININGMQVGASADKGTNVMAVAVDKDIPTAVLPALMNIDGIHDVKVIHCEH